MGQYIPDRLFWAREEDVAEEARGRRDAESALLRDAEAAESGGEIDDVEEDGVARVDRPAAKGTAKKR
jgi:hypothetical protein